MESRSAQLSRRNRRILGWSLGAAALLHLALFVLFPALDPPLPDYEDGEVTRVSTNIDPVFWIDVSFGPPLVELSDGRRRREPPSRVLEVARVDIGGALPEACGWIRSEGFESASGTVALRVGVSGRVQYVRTESTTGDPCLDAGLVAVAEDLWYHWLPNDEAPAPVDLIQPIRIRPSS